MLSRLKAAAKKKAKKQVKKLFFDGLYLFIFRIYNKL